MMQRGLKNFRPTEVFRSTQRAVVQKSCSTVGILLGKLIQTFLENVLLNRHYGREAAKIFLTLRTIFDNLLKSWMFVMKHT